MVQQAVASATNEIENQVDTSILTSSHLLSVNGNQVLGTVRITDVNAADAIDTRTKVNTKVKKQTIKNVK